MCLFIGPMVRQGNYYLKGYDHYDMLRTLEDMYDLPYAGNSANGHTIDEIWMTSVGVSDLIPSSISATVYPNPLTDHSLLVISGYPENNNNNLYLLVFDIEGKRINEEVIHLIPGTNSYAFRKNGLSNGIYTFQIRNEKNLLHSGKVVID